VNGHATEKTYLEIGGVRQGMFIQRRHEGSPVLLYLHGGMPEYFLERRHPSGMAEHFTVVWWEQRGSGLSYRAASTRSVDAEALIADALSLSEHLCDRFDQPKIYLLGHSGGTFIGIQAAARAPELYHAYLGVAQMSRQLKSEQLAHAYMLRRFSDQGDRRMVRRLESAPVGASIPLPGAYLRVRDVAMHRLGIGTMHEMRSVTALALESFRCPAYTLREKIDLWRGKLRHSGGLWNAQLATDLTQQVRRLSIPAYFVHGVHDYTVSYGEAKAFFQQLSAPAKGFYTFEHSAHCPMFEEPARMREILVDDVLRGCFTHADGPTANAGGAAEGIFPTAASDLAG
jgi:pimeloyl-ACP methyl ester carboxylesterase